MNVLVRNGLRAHPVNCQSDMTPAWKQRLGCDTAAGEMRWRAVAPPLSKRIEGVQRLQPWSSLPIPDTIPPATRTHRSPPVPVFHTRHAEQSAERPRLVTVVRPCAYSALRKVTVLLNRRGVVSYEQLLLDISEALGFPRWHRARVTRLYTPQAREVRGVCDFFRGELAFLALGKSRPELRSVKEALEELFPQYSCYRDDALRTWERKLRPPPDKAAKADSGYSDGTETHTHRDTEPQTHRNTRTQAGGLYLQRHTNRRVETHSDRHATRPTHPPNHLQRVRVKGVTGEKLSLPIGPCTQDEELRDEIDKPPPPRCRNCKLSDKTNQRAGRVTLPPVTRKHSGNQPNDQVVEKPKAGLAPRHTKPIGRIKEKSLSQSECFSTSKQEEVGNTQTVVFDLPSDGSVVTLSDIERCYDIGRMVGDGNFAVVCECHRRDTGDVFAMKIVDHSKLIGREHMMQNELSLMGSLSHPRLVRLFTHHQTETHSYLVMEMVAGGDLFEAIAERGKYPEEEAGQMVCDVSEALRYIHNKSIVHRDLKPENLMVEYITEGFSRLKLGDFGLAMVVTEPIFTVCGTPTYVAPEILSETGYGLPVDLWALGVILYILLCGFPPFRSQNRDQEELFQLIREAHLSFLSPYWDNISDGARSLVRALLQVDPTERLTAAQTLKHPWIQNTPDQHRPTATTTDHDKPAKPIAEQHRQAQPVQSPAPPDQHKPAQPSQDQHGLRQNIREHQSHQPNFDPELQASGWPRQQEHPSTCHPAPLPEPPPGRNSITPHRNNTPHPLPLTSYPTAPPQHCPHP
ncbi:hypothetical protein UPYG_G00335380 [Umbra pygmaea]|uniref:non-specific serine/threonine protein kinase n=1 Tax=Umbra pygmaea TaxID=75934 RepID=A0ABD0WC97_UMBPY